MDQYHTELEDYRGYNARDPLGRTYAEAMIARGVHPSAQGLHPTYRENTPNWARVTNNILEGGMNAVHNTLADKAFNTILGVKEIGGNINKIGDALTPDGYSVPTEGPMRLAGRGVPEPVVSSGPLSRNSASKAHSQNFDKYLADRQRYLNDPGRQREGMASGAYEAHSNQLGRGLIPGDMIGESMNRHGGIHPVLKADWDAEIAGTRADPFDTRSDWQKWKDSVAGGRR